jgi:hypothetical protein
VVVVTFQAVVPLLVREGVEAWRGATTPRRSAQGARALDDDDRP